ncbi:hypothetical protein DFH07DRAFT_11886 [Mycena maculata]|uniref:Uncharacterized protein n=1 Tax=Mycena maculata TaxID=230809 RepID=A0AAD7K3S4_9AGAR|nr:hypothetical protein DFH07DRAFT_11886 [Mycena maculata]
MSSTIVRTLNASYGSPSYRLAYGGGGETRFPVSAFVTESVYLRGTQVEVDLRAITAMGVRCTEVEGARAVSTSHPAGPRLRARRGAVRSARASSCSRSSACAASRRASTVLASSRILMALTCQKKGNTISRYYSTFFLA